MAIGDLISLVGLLRDAREAVRGTPDGLGFSIVQYDDANRDHLRFVSLVPLTIHGFRLAIQVGDSGQEIAIDRIYRAGQTDVFGSSVEYEIEIPRCGIYVRPDAIFYVPLSKLPNNANSTADLRARFWYRTAKNEEREGHLQHIVRVRARLVESPPANKAIQVDRHATGR